MKTIIVKSNGNRSELQTFIKKLEKYTDRQIANAVICERLLDNENYNTVYGELKDAVSLNDYDLFLIGVLSQQMCESTNINTLQALNKAHTLVCDVTEYDSAKNYIIML